MSEESVVEVERSEDGERETLTLNKDKEEHSISFAKPDEVFQIVAIFVSAHRKANDGSLPEFNTKDVTQELTELVANHAVLVKRDDEGFVDAVIAFKFTNVWWNRNIKIMNQVFMSSPETRQSVKTLFELVDNAIELAQDLDMDIYFNPIGKYRNKMKKLLERKGFNQFGNQYQYRIDGS